MSIATEITRLQGIKTNIRTALVTQGIAQASSHNMADFSTDILAIQGGSEGVYVEVICNSVYQGYDIILSANEIELDRKQCPSSLVVNFFVSADDITLPATFTISNNHPDYSNNTTSFEAIIYGWYNTNILIPLIPIITSNSDTNVSNIICSGYDEINMPYKAFDDDILTKWYDYNHSSTPYLGYKFKNGVCAKKVYVNYSGFSGVTVTFTLKLQARNNDSEEWTELSTTTVTTSDKSTHYDYTFDLSNNTSKYNQYKITSININTPIASLPIFTLQIYG